MALRAPGRTRTPNRQIRSLVLYPIELRVLGRGKDKTFSPNVTYTPQLTTRFWEWGFFTLASLM
jgi:hypothetical protein